MEKSVTMGNYSPGEGVLRRLDPRTKLYSLILYVVLTLIQGHPLALGLSTALFIVAWGTSGCSLTSIVKSARSVLIMLLIAELFSLIWVPVETVLLTFWKICLGIPDVGGILEDHRTTGAAGRAESGISDR